MLIGDKYKIESNAENINLYKKNKKGTYIMEGYFSTVKNALDYLVDLEVAETGLKDLRTVVAKQDELYTLIDGLKS